MVVPCFYELRTPSTLPEAFPCASLAQGELLLLQDGSCMCVVLGAGITPCVRRCNATLMYIRQEPASHELLPGPCMHSGCKSPERSHSALKVHQTGSRVYFNVVQHSRRSASSFYLRRLYTDLAVHAQGAQVVPENWSLKVLYYACTHGKHFCLSPAERSAVGPRQKYFAGWIS
jgi:hypothetical protein